MKNKLFLMSLSLVGSIAIVWGLILALQGTHRTNTDTIINFYNWGDYIDPDVIEQFEDETGYRVIYETFDSNEAMIAKMSQGSVSYDLAVPSDYMVERLIDEALIQPLDYDRLNHWDALNPDLLNLSFDLGNRYSLPYLWGTLGILYRQDQLIEPMTSWHDLWRAELQNDILLFDGAREVLGIGLLLNGHSLNTKTPAAIAEAKKTMQTLLPNVRALVADEIKLYMVQGEGLAAVTFSGEAYSAMEENKNLTYVIPQEGSNLWLDTLVIPTSATNLDGAYALINFLLRPEIAAQNAEYIGYSTPNKAALAYLPTEMGTDPVLYPQVQTLDHLELFTDLGSEGLLAMNEAYLELKLTPDRE